MLEKVMEGRLGNQMFQYAALRGFQERFYPNEELVLVFPHGESAGGGFSDQLKQFKVRPYRVIDKAAMSVRQRCAMSLFFRLRSLKGRSRKEEHEYELRWANVLNGMGLHFLTQGYHDFAKCQARNKVFFGYYESARYFDFIRDQLIDEFAPVEPPLPKNRELYEQIGGFEAVCVSVRRGDFVSNPAVRKGAFVCDEDYFKRAVDLMREVVPDARFFVFSDDPAWCKENLTFLASAQFEDGTDPVFEKLRLMYSCKHFIISNSTFSWWAQYLSRNEAKVVIAPSRWRNYESSIDIYQDSWTLLDV